MLGAVGNGIAFLNLRKISESQNSYLRKFQLCVEVKDGRLSAVAGEHKLGSCRDFQAAGMSWLDPCHYNVVEMKAFEDV